MNLLLQINGDLPDRYPEHERRLYIWACKRKACRRKDGSVRGFRATRQTKVQPSASSKQPKTPQSTTGAAQPATNLGETLFGVKPTTNTSANPFASPASSGPQSNPFASPSSQSSNPFASTSSLAAKPPQKPIDEPAESLPQTFADKTRISAASPATQTTPVIPHEPWPEASAFSDPYPALHLDADKEYTEPEAPQAPAGVRVDAAEGSSSAGGVDKDLFESTMDRTFQKFADRLSQNPEQVLRYEFGGQPLLYSKKDAVGKLLTPPEGEEVKVKVQSRAGGNKMPRCGNCGAERVFELQLTPHLISELEAEEMGLDGMDWGTVILGVCSKDCQEKGKTYGEVGYVDEWVGLQWEELAGKR